VAKVGTENDGNKKKSMFISGKKWLKIKCNITIPPKAE
jgi:hypothetical protein